MVDVAGGGRDDVEVVEQPLGGRRHRLLAGVLGERGVDVAKRVHVLAQLLEVRASATSARRLNREQRGQPSGVLFQQLEAEQLLAACHRTRNAVGRVRHALRPLHHWLTPLLSSLMASHPSIVHRGRP